MTSVANAQSYSQDFSSGQGEFVALVYQHDYRSSSIWQRWSK